MKVRVKFTNLNTEKNALVDHYLSKKCEFVSNVYSTFMNGNDDVLFLVWNPHINQFMTVGTSRLSYTMPIMGHPFKVARDVLLEE